MIDRTTIGVKIYKDVFCSQCLSCRSVHESPEVVVTPFNHPVLTFPLDRFSGIRPFLRVVFVFEETVTAGRFPGFALISVALALYTDNAPRRAKPGTWD